MREFLVFFWLFTYYQGIGQKLTFDFFWNDEKLVLGKDYALPQHKDILNFSKIKCYISNVQFLADDLIIDSLSKKHHLLDLSNPSSLQFNSSQKLFNGIQFTLGVDSLTNAAGARGGDLDPTKGMYWTWQSGYINIKLEGTSQNCKGRKNKFQFHLGGFRNKQKCEQHIFIPIQQENDDVSIPIDLFELFSKIDLSNQYQIMSPGQEAKLMASWMASIFMH